MSLSSFCGMRRLLQEPICIQENVENFESDLLAIHLGDLFHISVELISPHQYGFPVLRPRKWTILRHKYKTNSWSSPWSAFAKMFQSDMWFGAYTAEISGQVPAWEVFFDTSPEDLFDELSWACSRPESRSKATGCPFESAEAVKDALLHRPQDVRAAFLNALTEVESTFLLHYVSQRPGQAYSLNQNPQVTFTASSNDHLHTLIRNTGVLWQRPQWAS